MTIKHSPEPWQMRSYVLRGADGVIDAESIPGNLTLLTLAPTAPHECDDPECPGNKNRLKLKDAEISWHDGFETGYAYALAEEAKWKVA